MKRITLLLFALFMLLAPAVQADETQGKELCKQKYDSYKVALSSNPTDSTTWTEFRVCTDVLKRWPEAAQVAGDALAKNVEIPEAHLIIGLAHYHAKEYSQAVDELKESIRLKNDQALAYFELAMSYLYLNEPDEAVKAGVRATELAPTNSAYYRQLAFAYFLTNDNDDCEAMAKKALTLDPNDVATYRILGNLYQREGRQADADSMFDQAIHANGRNATTNPFVADKQLPPPSPPPNPFPETIPVDDTETFLKAQWERMKQYAEQGDIDKTITYYSDYADVRDVYRASFQKMGPDRMKDVFSKLGELSDCEFIFQSATCSCSVSGDNGTVLEDKVHFEKNSDHIWRIKSF